MMYIVLTAMLALNVASEVLEAFKLIDSSLIHTLSAVDMKNQQIYTSLNRLTLKILQRFRNGNKKLIRFRILQKS
ncbi:MAG: hypothetical protein IPF54_26435 [Draconibacterium sp.]|nr:hypothetical protein [Draconibacterium sp.]